MIDNKEVLRKRTPVLKYVKPYNMKELCKIYGVSDKTMRKWMEPFSEEIGKRQGNIYNVAQIEVIFKHLGVPGMLD
jgi:transposase